MFLFYFDLVDYLFYLIFLTDGRFTPCSTEQQGAVRAKLCNFPPDKVM
jgi:hypothetical protein